MGVLGVLLVVVLGAVVLDAALLMFRGRKAAGHRVMGAGVAFGGAGMFSGGPNTIDSFEADLWHGSVTDTGDDSPFFL